MKETNITKLEDIFAEEYRIYMLGVKHGSMPLARTKKVYALEEALRVITSPRDVSQLRLRVRKQIIREEENEKRQMKIC